MKKSVKETVRELIEPTVTELGYRIWDITFSKIGADYHLEITIDSDAGIGIEDCERVHRAIDPLLDECDPIESFYYLEVSSPGIERELRTDFHINSSLGALVELKLFAPHTDGRKTVTGILESYADGVITVSEESGSLSLGREAVSKITTVYTED